MLTYNMCFNTFNNSHIKTHKIKFEEHYVIGENIVKGHEFLQLNWLQPIDYKMK